VIFRSSAAHLAATITGDKNNAAAKPCENGFAALEKI
jgi:hypothetical protein